MFDHRLSISRWVRRPHRCEWLSSPLTRHTRLAGQSMLLGAFARIDLVEGRAFQFTGEAKVAHAL
jgi:hypothetical protein